MTQSLRAALQELVDAHDDPGPSESAPVSNKEWLRLLDEHTKRITAAWANARLALAAPADERDALRYRWLRDMDGNLQCDFISFIYGNVMGPKTFDEAIDDYIERDRAIEISGEKPPSASD